MAIKENKVWDSFGAKTDLEHAKTVILTIKLSLAISHIPNV